MQNEFLEELDRWVLAVLQEKLTPHPDDASAQSITAADFAGMLVEYILPRVAENPSTCWTACGIDHASDREITRATTFNDELLAAGFIGAVAELGEWTGAEGTAFLSNHGVPAEDAHAISSALEVVIEKLGSRGQSIIRRLAVAPSPAAAIAQ